MIRVFGMTLVGLALVSAARAAGDSIDELKRQNAGVCGTARYRCSRCGTRCYHNVYPPSITKAAPVM